LREQALRGLTCGPETMVGTPMVGDVSNSFQAGLSFVWFVAPPHHFPRPMAGSVFVAFPASVLGGLAATFFQSLDAGLKGQDGVLVFGHRVDVGSHSC
jgi:hypothetical protein